MSGSKMVKTVLAAGMLMASAVAMAAQKPDVLFIAIDDMNDWTTLFDKNNPIQTPNLERLAARGAFFKRAYCVVPACVPSRTAILSGKSPINTHCYYNGHSRKVWRHGSVVSLSQQFRRNGYVAKGAGKIFGDHGQHKGDDPRGTKHSWDDFQPMFLSKSKHLNGYIAEKGKKQPLADYWFDWGMVDSIKQMGDERVIEYVKKQYKQAHDKPLFMAAGIFTPHLPFYAPPENFKPYPLNNVRMPLMPEDDMNDVPPMGIQMAKKEHFIYENVIKYKAPDPRSHERMVQSYQASADYSDKVVGRILDELDASGRTDNTIIVLWSDHGYHLGDKTSCVKFTLWEKANRVPFIVVAPGVTKPGSVIDQPVSLLDIYPTLMELAGQEPRDDLDGNSLVPLLKDPDSEKEWEPALMTQGRGNHAIRTKEYRYIRYHDKTEELYADGDPWNHTNLAAKPEYADVLARHRAHLPKTEAPEPSTIKPRHRAAKQKKRK
jgi:arylsulfatase A-like enzyme